MHRWLRLCVGQYCCPARPSSVFGMKNAIQQSTKTALDRILKDLIDDLNSEPG